MVQVMADGHMTESKRSLVENNMPRCDDLACVNVKAAIAMMICRTAEEDAGCGSGTEFVRHCRCLIGETEAAKNSQMAI
jgi:hypothetical protein